MPLQTWLLSLQDVTRQQFDCAGVKCFRELLKLDSPVSQKVGRVENLTQFEVLFFTFLVGYLLYLSKYSSISNIHEPLHFNQFYMATKLDGTMPQASLS